MPRKERHLILLRTCRQIYTETKVLIIALSPLFSKLADITAFLTYTPLLSEQMQAIRHFHMLVYIGDLVQDAPNFIRLGVELCVTLRATKGLTGLRRITIAFCDRFCTSEWVFIAWSLRKEVERFVEEHLLPPVKIEIVDSVTMVKEWNV